MKNTPLKKIIKPFIICFLTLIGVLLIIAANMSKTYEIERRIEIQSTPSELASMVGDFSRWNEWSPWYEMEPTAQFSFEGEMEKPGSSIKWQGKAIGTGQIKLTAKSESNIIMDLTIEKPRAYTSQLRWKFKPMSTNQVQVVWEAKGDLDYPFGRLFRSAMQEMIGKDMSQGLQKLKSTVESSSPSQNKGN